MQIIDLSQDIYEGMKVYPGHLKTVQFEHVTHEETAPPVRGWLLLPDHRLHPQRQRPDPRRLVLPPGPGRGRRDDRPDAAGAVLRDGGVPRRDVFAPQTDITAEDLDRIEAESPVDVRRGDIVLFHTGTWNKFAGDKRYLTDFAGLGASAAEWIVQRGVKTFGVDSPTPTTRRASPTRCT